MRAVCPYCRCGIDDAADPTLVCAGCGTPHHADCYDENGGCTVFGCSNAPAEEPKVSVGTPELAQAVAVTAVAAPPRLVPPPPPPSGLDASSSQWVQNPLPQFGNVLFVSQPVSHTTAPSRGCQLSLDEKAKSRTTFLVLGVLFGALGLHNFYAGYRKKGWAQLALTILSMGFASPMSWVWAVIDVCTVTEDADGVKFRN